MKIVSLNIRGFKQEGKVKWFKEICNQSRADIIAVQETKCGLVGDNWVEFLWGSKDFGFIQKEAIGRSGGMLLIWDTNAFVVNQAVERDYFLAIKGNWKGHNCETIIVNVYGPHSDDKKKEMWTSLGLMEYGDVAWVFCGDFNEVRSMDERKNSQFHERKAARFNRFIDSTRLIEVPLV
ncbi:uncharacterized protein [Rutidosis leptorrhynchoides]|uniref:uncharacterized protein n=1 Tax=Rutidosis leptorrhynchoides TaxID=125765 RepID=UPI003A997BF0